MIRNLISRSIPFQIPQLFYPSCTQCQSQFMYQYRQLSKSKYPTHSKSQDVVPEDDSMIGKGDKVVKVRLRSTRLDAVLKAGLNISRSKIEKVFYEDRIRVNGHRAKKKSQVAAEGDEVDIVRGSNKSNPLFIDVNRVELVEIGDWDNNDDDFESDDDDEEEEKGGKKIPVLLKRYKNLTVENYPIPWKGNTQES